MTKFYVLILKGVCMIRDVIAEIYPWETRVGIIEDDRLVELFWTDKKENIGNIYKASVKDVLPGLSCAFVDIGLAKNAFLYLGDVVTKPGNAAHLKSGQEIMVQVKKEAFSEKGARVTGYVTFPGHFLVLLPFQNEISVSRKISGDQRRDELRSLVAAHLPENIGAIIRTSCNRADFKDILNELQELLQVWDNILQKFNHSKSPSLLYEDIEAMNKALREYLDNDTRRVVINNLRLKENIQEFIKSKKLSYNFSVDYEEGDLYEKYGLEREIRKAIKRKVWLKSGGYLIFDETEAMTVIDVNSGKFTGNDDFEETVLKINLEAALEIPRQLRLRSMGGIILIDFIDMQSTYNQCRVIDVLKQELQKDKAHTRVMGITSLGFLEMTRKKSRYGISDIFTDECSQCRGHGHIMNLTAISSELKRKMINCGYLQGKQLICATHSEVIDLLKQEEEYLQYISRKIGKVIKLVAEDGFNRLDYKIYSE